MERDLRHRGYTNRTYKNKPGQLRGIIESVLGGRGEPADFNSIFLEVYGRQDARELYSGIGEEMYRLRCYEQLQNLVASRKVKKTNKLYELKTE